MGQFSELRQGMEERQDRLTQEFQALMAEIRGHHQPQDGESNLGEDGEESAGAAARRRREHGRRSRGAAHGRGRGQGRRHDESDDFEDVDDNSYYKILLVADLIEEVTKKRGWVN